MRGKQLTCAQLSGRRGTAALAGVANLPARHFPAGDELQVHPSPTITEKDGSCEIVTVINYTVPPPHDAEEVGQGILDADSSTRRMA